MSYSSGVIASFEFEVRNLLSYVISITNPIKNEGINLILIRNINDVDQIIESEYPIRVNRSAVVV